ncbi:hypothetical protein O7047_08955 [Pseudenterobacter timonensis]|uniref:Uncharacterized protein n=2 Tax=Pseudenterobacter timonensis TaxID=1755099 RepID=A0AAE4DM53_9ENTR|nr:hypothetical protein [Pseudenterobacter timonensis]MDR9890360.1 hypothetical protein [Pseudenterobacter timonensis]
MKRSELEQLTDELIGEAVLSLLKEKGPISIKTLIARLRVMKTHEQDEERREALQCVITEIASSDVGSLRNNKEEERNERERNRRSSNDNVYPLFGVSQQGTDSKKH